MKSACKASGDLKAKMLQMADPQNPFIGIHSIAWLSAILHINDTAAM